MSVISAKFLLNILQVDVAIIDEATGYLRIIMCGLIFNFIYNFFASTLRAMGDSRSPLYFLGISAVVNIIGDLIFVMLFNMGTIGCAISTVLSEVLSCIMCWFYIKKKIPILNMGKKWLVFDKSLLKETLQYGFVSAMQQSTVQMGKLGIQSIVNTMGVSATAAFSAINRIDDYALVPEHNISFAMTSVMAQNRGAGEMKRVDKAFRAGMTIELIYGAIIGILLFVFAKPILGLFTNGDETIELGLRYIRLIAFMYVIPALTNAIQGYFRGMGDLKVTLWSSIANMGARVISCIPLVFVFKMGIEALPWSYLIGWIAMMAYEMPYFMRLKYGKNIRN